MRHRVHEAMALKVQAHAPALLLRGLLQGVKKPRLAFVIDTLSFFRVARKCPTEDKLSNESEIIRAPVALRVKL